MFQLSFARRVPAVAAVMMSAAALLAAAPAAAEYPAERQRAPQRPFPLASPSTSHGTIVRAGGQSHDVPDRSRDAAKAQAKAAVPLAADDEAAALEGLQRESVIPAAGEEYVIDLPTALRLAESSNPTIALGRQAIVEAVALQGGARALLLPSLNAGSNYHLHSGALQTSFGELRNLNSQSIYIGGGARTLAAETVAVPAVRIFSHLGDALFAPLAAGQIVCARNADSIAIDNSTLLLVVQRYLDLAMAESSLDAIHQGEDSMRVIVLATAAFARTGQGREGDFNRARADALLLHNEEQQLQEEVAVASAALSRVLHLDPSVRLRTQPGMLEIVQLVNPKYDVQTLVEMAQTARPELAARMSEISAAEYRVRQENTRPFLPVVSVGFSGGAFGGGGNFNPGQSMFQTFGGRTDFDVMAVWSVQNLGFGNSALQKRTRAERDQAIAARGLMANRVAREVGDAYAKSESRKRQLSIARQRLESAITGAQEELQRTRGGESLPIEGLNSVRLLGEAGMAMVQAVGGYDQAQFELFVAIGQTPESSLPDPGRREPKPPVDSGN